MRRNLIAKELRENPKFRPQIVRNRKTYSRKEKHPSKDSD